MDVIGSEIQRLDRVVQTLVDFTKPVELRLGDIDLRRVVEDVSVLAAPEAARHGVTVGCELPAEALVVKADADLVKQAVLNIALNGIQAMPGGGALTLAARRDDDAIEIEVRDQGPGIPPEIRDKNFQPVFHHQEVGQRNRPGHELSRHAIAQRIDGIRIRAGSRDGVSSPVSGHRSSFTRPLRARAPTRRKSRHRDFLAQDVERDLEQHYANRARHRRGHTACILAGPGRMQEEKARRAHRPAQAPTITQPEPEVQPPVPAASEPNRPQPEVTQPEPEPAATTAPAPKPKTKPRPAKKTVPPPPVDKPAEKPAEKQPSKTVVTEGGTQPATPQLSPSMPNDTSDPPEAQHHSTAGSHRLQPEEYFPAAQLR